MNIICKKTWVFRKNPRFLIESKQGVISNSIDMTNFYV